MNVTVDLWQSEHSPDTGCGTLPLCGSVSGRRTLGGVPGHSATVLSWQGEQAIAVTALCTIAGAAVPLKIGRGSWRGRGELSVVAVSLKKKRRRKAGRLF